MRPKRFDRMSRQFNIDKDLDEWLRNKYPGLASEKVNELLRNEKEKEEKKVVDLVGQDSNAGRLAYIQAMEKTGFSGATSWKSLNQDDQLRFIKVYKERLVDLQARGM